MELLVSRIAKRETYTIGRMYIMEKIPRQKAMPEGMGLPKVTRDDKPPGMKHPVTCDKEGWRYLMHGGEQVTGRQRYVINAAC